MLEPPAVNMKSEIPVFPTDPLDLNVLLDGQQMWEYRGGLPGPPCAEVVTWLVMVNPIKASNTQVAYIHDGIFIAVPEPGKFVSHPGLLSKLAHDAQSPHHNK